MLTALELVGFKSFADKTRFEFPPGITVVVGPNGSGKSNIVDAIKWVLGEQSAKSLRGGEMADIIYKGSASGNRKPFQSAEASIVFDNTSGILPVEETEVHVTRRVFRSGEGEYMVNGRACRLRDVKDLFSGTGVGADAYSLIEQGKVDSLLQASNRDRRAIFEEAAGISRFKAKKIETRRRLDRVEQNLVRLADIVDEVEGRLRALRSQATKAQRYKQYSDRLRELRTHVGLHDWRRLTDQIDLLDLEITDLDQKINEENATNTSFETSKLVVDSEIEQARATVKSCEANASQLRELIASRESDIVNRRRFCEDIETEAVELRQRLLMVTSRAGDIRSQEKQEKRLLAAAENERNAIATRLEKSEAEYSVGGKQLEQTRQGNQLRRTEHAQRMRESASLTDRISSFRSQLDSADANAARHESHLKELDEQRVTLTDTIECLCDEKDTFDTEARLQREKLEEVRNQLAARRRRLAENQQELSDLQSRLVGARERTLVLEELERRLEGLSAGVKEVLGRARDDERGPFADVRGLVADLIRVNVESATLIEAALGKMAQYVVFSGNRLPEYLRKESRSLKGRAGFVCITPSAEADSGQLPDLESQPGVLGRADRFVTTTPDYQPLVTRLLARTWFVKSLSHALTLQAQTPGVRFVTPAGELVEADGSFQIGPGNSATGLISRRSELRALRMQIDDLNRRIEIERTTVARCKEEIHQGESEVERFRKTTRTAEASLYEHRGKLRAAEERRSRLEEERKTIESELHSARKQSKNVSGTMEASAAALEEMKSVLAETEAILADEAATILRLEEEQGHQSEIVTEGKIELARGEQRIESHRAALRQFGEARRERSRAVEDIQGQIHRSTERVQQAEREILAATAETAQAWLDQEKSIAERRLHEEAIASLQKKRSTLTTKIREIAARLKKVEQKRHTHEITANGARMERETLAERLRDDYGIELAELLHNQQDLDSPLQIDDASSADSNTEDTFEQDDDEFDVDDTDDEGALEEVEDAEEEEIDSEQRMAEIENEMESLRHKLATIGSVNMEALAELEELESRYNALSSQYQDLTDARDTLERIINRINSDSRRLFAETLETIRTNFCNLFRQVFGGGNADIILEEGVDILDAGVEIIAMPPGKHALNISLLSGGEKAMTAVTLLLAIFQFRPSPFCVLDEVDGPLDEANIGRFISTLKTFLDTTRFVIVTHSKKTMTAATTLYGVTMQESGISKKVSVRFDEVGENGEISPDALTQASDTRKAA